MGLDVQHFLSMCSGVPSPTSHGDGNVPAPQTTFLFSSALVGCTFLCLPIPSWQLVEFLCDLVLSFICATRWVPDG